MSGNLDNASLQLIDLSPEIVLQPPLFRRAFGPGLILVRPSHYSQYERHNITLDPEPVQK
jgi:carboxymethylenebutenolidase